MHSTEKKFENSEIKSHIMCLPVISFLSRWGPSVSRPLGRRLQSGNNNEKRPHCRRSAGGNPSSLPHFAGVIGKQRKGPPHGLGCPTGHRPVSSPPERGQRGDRPRLSMGCTEVCSPVVCSVSAVGIRPAYRVCLWLNSYWSIGAIKRGVGEAGKVGIASQPPPSKRSTAGHRAMHVGIACAWAGMCICYVSQRPDLGFDIVVFLPNVSTTRTALGGKHGC